MGFFKVSGGEKKKGNGPVLEETVRQLLSILVRQSARAVAHKIHVPAMNAVTV